MPHICLSVSLADPDLFDATCEAYREEVEAGNRTIEEAEADLLALAEGMLKLEVSPA